MEEAELARSQRRRCLVYLTSGRQFSPRCPRMWSDDGSPRPTAGSISSGIVGGQAVGMTGVGPELRRPVFAFFDRPVCCIETTVFKDLTTSDGKEVRTAVQRRGRRDGNWVSGSEGRHDKIRDELNERHIWRTSSPPCSFAPALDMTRDLFPP